MSVPTTNRNWAYPNEYLEPHYDDLFDTFEAIDQDVQNLWDYVEGVQRKKAVINVVDNTAAPPTEVSGDRYILDETVGTIHASWDGASKNDVVEFNGTAWVAETPSEGWIAYVDTQNADYRYVYDGSGVWEKASSAATIYDDTTTFTDIASAGSTTTQLDVGTIDDGICQAVQVEMTAGTSTNTTIQIYDGDPTGAGTLIYEVPSYDLSAGDLDDRNCWYVEFVTTGDLWVKVSNDGAATSSYSVRLRIKGDE